MRIKFVEMCQVLRTLSGVHELYIIVHALCMLCLGKVYSSPAILQSRTKNGLPYDEVQNLGTCHNGRSNSLPHHLILIGFIGGGHNSIESFKSCDNFHRPLKCILIN